MTTDPADVESPGAEPSGSIDAHGAGASRSLDFPAAATYVVVVVLLWMTDWSMAKDLLLPGEHSPQLSLGLLLVGATTTAFRKRRPLVVLVVTGLSATLAMLLTGELGAAFLQFEAAFSAVLYGTPRLARNTTVLCVVLTIAGTLATTAVSREPELWFAAGVQLGVVLILPLLWAWEVRNHSEARRQAEIAAAAQRQLAVRERELAEARAALQVQEHGRRIAQDLHDGVAGHLSAIALQTAALRTEGMRTAPAATRDKTLESIRTASVDALTEMRTLIDVLREGMDQDLDHRGTWGSLAARLRASFPEARATEAEQAGLLLDHADPATAQAALRVAQESVTNVLKHASPGPVDLLLTHEDGALHLLCRSRTTTTQPREDDGLGLRSMRLRTEESGGTFTAGPVATDSCATTWTVEAIWPATTTPPAQPLALPRRHETSVEVSIQHDEKAPRP